MDRRDAFEAGYLESGGAWAEGGFNVLVQTRWAEERPNKKALKPKDVDDRLKTLPEPGTGQEAKL